MQASDRVTDFVGGFGKEAGLARQRANESSNLIETSANDAVSGSNATRLSSAGVRNSESLTQIQIDDASDFARELGFDGPIDCRSINNGYNTSYSDWDWLMIFDDLLPDPKGRAANSRMSWRAVIGREITGHREANLAGKSFDPGSLRDEVQASVRASRLTTRKTIPTSNGQTCEMNCGSAH